MAFSVYGPVFSRRLGRSLGVDVVPYKTCTYDCIYCQLGRTTAKSVIRRHWVPVEELLSQLAGRLHTRPDWVTLGGSGEPTLYAGIGELIRRIKTMTDIPVAVLTNGSLLWSEQVRDDLLAADLVIPSLDAGSPELFEYVNRPHKSISFQRMVEGLIEFCRVYAGQYWLEVLLVGGITGLTGPVEQIATIADNIDPDRIHLNTVVRPPVETYAGPTAIDLLECFAAAFGDKATVIAEPPDTAIQPAVAVDPEALLDLLSRRPSTLEDIAKFLGIHRTEAVKYMDQLTAQGRVSREYQSQRLFYRAVSARSNSAAVLRNRHV